MSEYLKGQGINPGDPLPDNFFGQDDPYTVGENASSLVQYEPERLWEESSIDFDGIGNDLSGGGAAQYAQEAEKYEAWEAKQRDKAYLAAYEATDPSIRNLPSVEAEMGRQADMSVGIIEAHILPKLLEDQERAYLTTYMAVVQSYPSRQKEADMRAEADKRFAAGLMGTDSKDMKVLYAGHGAIPSAGLFRGEIIGYANHKVFQRVDDNTVVVHYDTSKLNGSRVGEVMEINYYDQKQATRTIQVLTDWQGERCCHLTKGETEAAKDESKEKDTGKSKGMGW